MKIFDKIKKTIKEEKKEIKKPEVKKRIGNDKLNYKDAYRILVKPINTEKSTNLTALNQHVFEVTGNSNKIEIKKAIQAVYNVKPISVNIIKTKGKNVKHGKTKGKTKARKKAIITLKQGEKIENY
ncbi:50S ribosomal protein L23 [Candidatus Kuenenbacteria bacterium HGW-Kuenenbacteria-1]|uniref:Large ribosomal subunit protein uL23 n=1 Tax=Candidatus Kuenenbacteria bacterium HGW-Kuenenbacteria-1 TaxID=2013812 RepID=A0A2N1UNF0_9BACT|nr:MAG: 50S ribosomal protein L23 [Candidatus Kuenenbacteria bacterium HGW-Kuenenbacteria-1]